jgi:putative flippase GtrA
MQCLTGKVGAVVTEDKDGQGGHFEWPINFLKHSIVTCCIIPPVPIVASKTMETSKKNTTHAEIVRFLLVGATNTIISYVLYLLLLRFVPYLFAYSISYGIGIVISYVLNSSFVFRKPLSMTKFLQFPVVYAIQYGLGAALLWLLVGQAALAPELAMLAVVAATIPVTFVTSRFILKR